MNQYKYLIRAGTGVLVVLSLFLLTVIGNISDSATNNNTISFNGEGKISAKPDIAAISFSIVTEATTSKSAQDENSVKSNKVADFLKQQNIDPKDVKTSGYNVYPQYSTGYKPCSMMYPADGNVASYPCQQGNPKVSGYQVTQSFEVKVRNLDNVGTILDGLVSAGANQVNNLGFQFDNPEALKDQARAMAIADAKLKAKDLKRQLGIRLGKIVNFSEGTNYPIYFESKVADGTGRGGATPAIPTGENEITSNVTITYQIR